MKNLLEITLKDIMTESLVTAFPDMNMTTVSEIFDNNSFHHIPVLDESECCVGVISKSDYYQLQDQFTKKNTKTSEVKNRMFFRSLRAEEVMTTEPISVPSNATVQEALNIFLENKVHSIVVTEANKCVGIVTPFDILKQINTLAYA